MCFPYCKRYAMESYWTKAKTSLSYISTQGIYYGPCGNVHYCIGSLAHTLARSHASTRHARETV